MIFEVIPGVDPNEWEPYYIFYPRGANKCKNIADNLVVGVFYKSESSGRNCRK